MRPRQVPAGQFPLFAPDRSSAPTARYTDPASTHPLLARLQLVLDCVWLRLHDGRLCRSDREGHLLPAEPGDVALLTQLDAGHLIWWTPRTWLWLNGRIKYGWAPRLDKLGRARNERWARRHCPTGYGSYTASADLFTRFPATPCPHRPRMATDGSTHEPQEAG